MKFAPLYVLLWAAPNLVAAQSEVICPGGKFKTTKSLGLDEYIDYKTQDGAPSTEYTNGVNCNVLFKRKKGSDCDLKFNCTHFDLKSKKPAPKCQDKMIISGKKYCQSIGPDVTTSSSKLKVSFKTNKKGTATGAVCTAYCVPPPPPPGNTEGSSPASDGFVRITSFVISPEVSGSVTFKESSDCDTNGPQNYEINSNNFAIVPFNGTCKVQEIFAIVTGTPIVSCNYTSMEGSDDLDFIIKLENGTSPFPPCIIEPTPTGTSSGLLGATKITIDNRSNVNIIGTVTGRTQTGRIVNIPYGPIVAGTSANFIFNINGFPTNFMARNAQNNLPCAGTFTPSIAYIIRNDPNVASGCRVDTI